jgi:hypothetical protein
MIKGITAGGKFIQVENGYPGHNYINASSGAQGVGNLRYNTSAQNMEVFDGLRWIQLNTNYTTVKLSHEAEQLLDWARNERNRQIDRDSRVKNNPALQKAYEAIKRAEDNFDILEKFVEHDKEM